MSEKQETETGHESLHGWFGLSYASYLTIPRSILQSMPDEWQGKMAALLGECDEACMEHDINWPGEGLQVRVELVPLKDRDDEDEPAIRDPLSDYRRGSVRLW